MIHKKYIKNRGKENAETGQQKRSAHQEKTGDQMSRGAFRNISYGAKTETEKKSQYKFIVRFPVHKRKEAEQY